MFTRLDSVFLKFLINTGIYRIKRRYSVNSLIKIELIEKGVFA